MAWTTSACLRARPILWDLAATQLKTARFLLAWGRRCLSRWHPNFAFAVPLAALGFLTPLLPTAFTATLLLAAGSALAVFAVRTARPRAAQFTQVERAAPPITTQAVDKSKITARPGAPAAFPTAAMVFDWQRQAGLSLAARSPSSPHDRRDRSWAELMARVNHDLRTPLNAVIGFSELIVLELYGPVGDQRYQDYAQHIRDSATDLLKSAEDTLALTALMANPDPRENMSACDLDKIAADAWAFISRKAAARSIDFEACIPNKLEVLGERRALRQILVNMLSEGIARAAHGERVILTAVSEGELIELALSVSRERPRGTRKDSSLAICLARMLLEMQGTSLLEFDSASQGWHAVTVLDRAVQPDFFVDRFGGQARESMAALMS